MKAAIAVFPGEDGLSVTLPVTVPVMLKALTPANVFRVTPPPEVLVTLPLIPRLPVVALIVAPDESAK